MRNNDYHALQQRLIRARRSMCRDSGIFRQYYFPHYHKVQDAAFHVDLTGRLGRMSNTRSSKIAIAAPRGSAKSTIVTLEYVIYSICYRIEEFIVLISSTADHAAESLANIKHELETNDRLKKDFPEVCELDKKPSPPRWSQREIITKNNIKVTALGVGQNIRGKRHNQYRPSLVILDDIEGNEAVQNQDNRYKLKDWFEKSVLKAGHNGTNFIFVGTIHHYGSLLAQYTDPRQAPGWESQIYRSVIKWSEALQKWQLWRNIYHGDQQYNGLTGPEAARDYFADNQGAMLEGVEVLWPESKSYYDLMVIREREGEVSFDSEMQNEPVNPRDCLFNLEEFHYWDEKFTDEEALFGSIVSPQFFAACDPSLGKSTARGDFSAIIVGVKDLARNKLYLLDADMQRRKPENLIEVILGYAKGRKISSLIFETNQFQQVLLDEIKKRAGERNLYFTTFPIENRKDKISRIHALETCLKTGQIQLKRTHRALLDQFKYFPKGQHDDGPDAVEMLFQGASKCVDWSVWAG